ncbi:MAG: hypothetical protein Q9207_005802 [Kuettlingeria erythrocarpa]
MLYRHHRRGFRSHKHGGSKHTDGVDANPSTSLQKPSLTAMDSGKHMLPTTTADVASVHSPSSVEMLKATPTKMIESTPTVPATITNQVKSLPTDFAKSLPDIFSNGGHSMASMHPFPASNGKPLPTATPKLDESTAQTHPDDRDALTAKPGKGPSSQSVGQRLQAVIHKPVVWAALIGVFVVLLIATVMIVRAVKKCRTRRVNDQKTRDMAQWHRDRGLV